MGAPGQSTCSVNIPQVDTRHVIVCLNPNFLCPTIFVPPDGLILVAGNSGGSLASVTRRRPNSACKLGQAGSQVEEEVADLESWGHCHLSPVSSSVRWGQGQSLALLCAGCLELCACPH